MIFHHIKNLKNQVERPDFLFVYPLLIALVGVMIIIGFHDRRIDLSIAEDEQNEPVSIEQSDLKAIISDDINLIKNLTQDEVSSLWGAPDFLRGEGDIIVWQYKSATCVVDVYWDQKENADPIIRHISVRGENDKKCIRGLF